MNKFLVALVFMTALRCSMAEAMLNRFSQQPVLPKSSSKVSPFSRKVDSYKGLVPSSFFSGSQLRSDAALPALQKKSTLGLPFGSSTSSLVQDSMFQSNIPGNVRLSPSSKATSASELQEPEALSGLGGTSFTQKKIQDSRALLGMPTVSKRGFSSGALGKGGQEISGNEMITTGNSKEVYRAEYTSLDEKVYLAAFSPDGKKIVSAWWEIDSNGRVASAAKIDLWDVASGRHLKTISAAHGYAISSVAFSPDGTKIVSSSMDLTTKFWDADTGNLIRTITHNIFPTGAVFSPDGTKIISGIVVLALWDVATGKRLNTKFENSFGSGPVVVFSPDSAQVVSSKRGNVLLWEVATGKLLKTFTKDRLGKVTKVTSVAFSPDGKKIVSALGDGTVEIWEVATGNLLSTFTGDNNRIRLVAFSPDGEKIVSVSVDGTVKFWDVATGSLILTFNDHQGLIDSAAFSPDSRQVVLLLSDGMVRIWKNFNELLDGVKIPKARSDELE